jgi:hypothetical protein
MWITGIDAEVPVASIPVEWTIEVACCAISGILPVIEYVTHVEVTIVPVCTVEVIV